MNFQRLVRQFFSGVATAFAWGRVALANLLVLLVFVAVVLVLVSSGSDAPTLESGSAMVLDPSGTIVEQRTAPTAMSALTGSSTGPTTRLGDIVEALAQARDDDRVGALFIDVGELDFVQPAHLDAIGTALDRFRETGREVVAFGDYFSQGQYYLASFADQIYLAPMGEVSFAGYGLGGFYLKDLLEKLKVNVHVFRVGEFKSAVEAYTRNDMSDATRLSYQALVDEYWATFLERIALNRGIEPDQLADYANRYDEYLAAAGGDSARAALERGLVDELITSDELRSRLAAITGEDDSGYRGLSFADYLRPASPFPGGDTVAVITASGTILPGQGRSGVGAEAMGRLIRQARDNDDVRALVVRIDSPGGSAFASEAIRRELELLQMKGKPVVASMGATAASGGYWIAATADRIVAAPSTITGSIGVFALVQTVEDTLEGIGVNYDAVMTGPLVGGLNVFDGVSEQMGRVLQFSVDHIYEQFVHLVARGRDLSPDAVRAVAEGRVWSGQQALAHGLVDQLGHFSDAVATAAELAGISDPKVRFLRRPMSPQEEILALLAEDLADASPAPLQGALARTLLKELEIVGALRDPRHVYAICEACTVLM